MKIKGMLKGLLTVVALGLFTTQANAVTLVSGQSYQLTGAIQGISSVAGFTGAYNLTPAGSFSYFTYNVVGGVGYIDVVLNLVQTDGDRATLRIDNLVVGGTGTALTMSAPPGSAALSNGYKDIGNFFPVNNPAAFTNFAQAMPGQLNTAANTFKIWGAYYNLAGTNLGGTDFHLNIGNNVSAQVPEPMTMSLLGMGLLGGAINRRRKVAA